jgi:hypothetical protein
MNRSVGDLAFICGENGGPLTKEIVRQCLSRTANSAGVAKSDGVRNTCATRAGEL